MQSEWPWHYNTSNEQLASASASVLGWKIQEGDFTLACNIAFTVWNRSTFGKTQYISVTTDDRYNMAPCGLGEGRTISRVLEDIRGK